MNFDTFRATFKKVLIELTEKYRNFSTCVILKKKKLSLVNR